MIELSPEVSIYKLIYNSSYYLLDFTYHYFEPNYVGFISHELIIILIFGYNKVSNFNPCSFMCIFP